MNPTPTKRFRQAASFTFDSNVSTPQDLTFNHAFPHTYCRICGTVFQTPNDRQPFSTAKQLYENTERRKNWSNRHAQTHTSREHLELAISGLWVTPDAAYKLEGYGIHSVGSAILNENVEAALREAPNTPLNDVEGSR